MGSFQHFDIDPLVQKIAKHENIINPKYEYRYSTTKGSGFLGLIDGIELSGDNKSLDLIVKTALQGEKFRQQTPIRDAYIAEIYFYEKVFPELWKFQQERKILKPFSEIPKCYATCSAEYKELLIMNDIKKEGFELFNKKQTMNAEHVKFVFEVYGRFHATSFAIKDQNYELYKRLVSNMTNLLSDFAEKGNLIKMMTEMGKKILDCFDTKSEKLIADKFSLCIDQISDIMKNCRPDEYSTILHGDCWCNNMMFKYKEKTSNQEPCDIRLLDFQLIREGSPVFDLSYFFYVCASKELMNNLESYLKVYHESFSKHLRALGSDPEKLYSYSRLKSDWRNHSKFGLVMAIFLVKLMLSEVDETPDFVETAEQEDDYTKAFDYESKNDVEYRRRLKDIIIHFYNNNFL